MTKYVVLELNQDIPDSQLWGLAGYETARSANAAIRSLLNGDDRGGQFVAVPARSWQPVKVAVETALKFS